MQASLDHLVPLAVLAVVFATSAIPVDPDAPAAADSVADPVLSEPTCDKDLYGTAF